MNELVDDGISGAEFANRPRFLRLMNSLKTRAPFQVLVMGEESRLGREAIETAYSRDTQQRRLTFLASPTGTALALGAEITLTWDLAA